MEIVHKEVAETKEIELLIMFCKEFVYCLRPRISVPLIVGGCDGKQ